MARLQYIIGQKQWWSRILVVFITGLKGISCPEAYTTVLVRHLRL